LWLKPSESTLKRTALAKAFESVLKRAASSVFFSERLAQ
jgi:hypothetical protein